MTRWLPPLEDEERWDMLDAELADTLEQAQESNRRKYELKLARQARQVDTEEPDGDT